MFKVPGYQQFSLNFVNFFFNFFNVGNLINVTIKKELSKKTKL